MSVAGRISARYHLRTDPRENRLLFCTLVLTEMGHVEMGITMSRLASCLEPVCPLSTSSSIHQYLWVPTMSTWDVTVNNTVKFSYLMGLTF